MSKLKVDAITESWNDHVISTKVIGSRVYALQPFLFTYGVLLDLTVLSYRGRYCFGSLAEAKVFWDAFDGSQVPIVGVDGCTAIKV